MEWFYWLFRSLISIVDTFRASAPSLMTSVPMLISFTVSFPAKNRRLTTSTTSTAVLMVRPRAFTDNCWEPDWKCIIIAVAYAIIGFLPIKIVSGGIGWRALGCAAVPSDIESPPRMLCPVLLAGYDGDSEIWRFRSLNLEWLETGTSNRNLREPRLDRRGRSASAGSGPLSYMQWRRRPPGLRVGSRIDT